MAKGINLACQKRENLTKGQLRGLRRKGMIPGIVYGKGESAMPVILDQAELVRIFRTRGRGGLYSLTITGEEPVMALVREVQRSPVDGDILHVDFMQVKMGENITAAVPIVLVGEEELVKQGAVIQVSHKEVEVECLPADLPDNLPVDISALTMGDKVLAQDLAVPRGVRVLAEPDTVILVISHPARAAEEPEAAEGEPEREGPAEGETTEG